MNLCPIAKLRRIPRLYLLKRLRVGDKRASFVLNGYVLRRLPRFLTLLDEEPSVINGSFFLYDKIYISIKFTLKIFAKIEDVFYPINYMLIFIHDYFNT